MTTAMILALVVLVAMILMIMFDVLPFGVPPLACCVLIVIFGSVFGGAMPELEKPWDISYAFAGFTNNTVWMLAFFMVILAAIQKTQMINKVKDAMTKLVEIGGFKSYVALLIVVMLGASILGMGSTAFYVLIFSLVVTMPYNDKLPGSKLMLPLGIASNHPLIPINVALQYGVAVSILASAGLGESPSSRSSCPLDSSSGRSSATGSSRATPWPSPPSRTLPRSPVTAPPPWSPGRRPLRSSPSWSPSLP